MTTKPQPEALHIADECEHSAELWLNEVHSRITAAAELRRLHAEREALRKELHQVTSYADALNERCVADAPDAERYRFLCDVHGPHTELCFDGDSYSGKAEFDAAIDAARAAKEQQ